MVRLEFASPIDQQYTITQFKELIREQCKITIPSENCDWESNYYISYKKLKKWFAGLTKTKTAGAESEAGIPVITFSALGQIGYWADIYGTKPLTLCDPPKRNYFLSKKTD